VKYQCWRFNLARQATMPTIKFGSPVLTIQYGPIRNDYFAPTIS